MNVVKDCREFARLLSEKHPHKLTVCLSEASVPSGSELETGAQSDDQVICVRVSVVTEGYSQYVRNMMKCPLLSESLSLNS